MLKLKGNVLNRLSPDKRVKMEKTLQRMDLIRREDDMRIRTIVETKKQWAEKEKEKGLNIIDQIEIKKEELTKEQEKIRLQLIKIEGCVLALNDVLNESAKIETEKLVVNESQTTVTVEKESEQKIDKTGGCTSGLEKKTKEK